MSALEILSEHGYAGLKQAVLCSSVGVTTGAFYHHFPSWRDFTLQLLDFWARERTANLVRLAEAQDDPVDRLLLLLEVTMQLPHRAEAAIRVWSALDADVAAVQREVDRQRLAVIDEAFRHIVGADLASSYANTGMALLVGFEQLPGVDLEALRWSLLLLLDAARSARPTS